MKEFEKQKQGDLDVVAELAALQNKKTLDRFMKTEKNIKDRSSK